MIPAFHDEKYGYNVREVDTCIDKMLAETERVTRINNQLFLLWVTHFRELEDTYQKSRAQGFEDDSVAWNKLSTLLGESAELWQPMPAVQETPKVVEGIVEETELPTKKPSQLKAICFNLVFYTSLIAIVFGVFLFRDSGVAGPPQNIAGYSVMTVLTRSMQDVLPQNSVIVTKQVDPSTIQVGDDITYLMSSNTTVTHRVISIHPNYAGTGQPGFETQGTMNERPDAEIVIAANVVGRVIFNSLALGKVILFIREHVLWVCILAGLVIALSVTLRVIFSKQKHERSIKNPT